MRRHTIRLTGLSRTLLLSAALVAASAVARPDPAGAQTAATGSGGTPTQDPTPTAVHAWVDAHQAELVDRLVEFLSLPNVAADSAAIRRNVAWLTRELEARGVETRVLETGGAPMVFGSLPARGADGAGGTPAGGTPDTGAATTILFYCHYDGQPADADAWVGHAPWDPVLRDGSLADGAAIIEWPADGEYSDDWRVYARSSSDDKSPIVMLLSALDALRAADAPPNVNLKFLFEGDEEAGSPHMRELIRRHAELLAADLVVMADGPEHGSLRPTLVYGARGIVTTRLIVYGPARPLHSGHFGNWAPNPAMRLAELLASMKDTDGRVLVDGFYDDVVPLSDAERTAIRAIPPDSPTDYGFAAPEGWAGELRLEATSLPSLNVRGMGSGWIGGETRTIVPDSAVAEIDLRLVPDIQPADQVERVRRHVLAQGYYLADGPPTPAERATHPRLARLVDLRDGYPGMKTPMDHPLARDIARAVERFTEAEPVHIPMLGGSVPAVWFPVETGTPVLLLPVVNPDNNQHSPNENLRLGNYFDGIRTLAGVMRIGGM